MLTRLLFQLFLLDDQPWMKDDWNLVGIPLEQLVDKTLEFVASEPGGAVGIDFISSAMPMYDQYSTTAAVMDVFAAHPLPPRKKMFAHKIDAIIGHRLETLIEQHKKHFPTSKSFNVIILTNGGFVEIQNQWNELCSVLRARIGEMEKYSWLRQSQIGLQFLRINASPAAAARLQHLDDAFPTCTGDDITRYRLRLPPM